MSEGIGTKLVEMLKKVFGFLGSLAGGKEPVGTGMPDPDNQQIYYCNGYDMKHLSEAILEAAKQNMQDLGSMVFFPNSYRIFIPAFAYDRFYTIDQHRKVFETSAEELLEMYVKNMNGGGVDKRYVIDGRAKVFMLGKQEIEEGTVEIIANFVQMTVRPTGGNGGGKKAAPEPKSNGVPDNPGPKTTPSAYLEMSDGSRANVCDRATVGASYGGGGAAPTIVLKGSDRALKFCDVIQGKFLQGSDGSFTFRNEGLHDCIVGGETVRRNKEKLLRDGDNCVIGAATEPAFTFHYGK